MRIGTASLLLLAFATVPAADRPQVFQGGVLSAASYALDGMPNEGIAQGSMFVVFGSGMGPAALRFASGFPLQRTLAGTSIRVTSGGVSTDAIMLYTYSGQVAAILPSNTPAGNATLTLSYNGQVSNAVIVRVVRTSFGVFTGNQRGYGPAIVQNWSPSTVTLNSPIQAAATNQVMMLWGTGLGPVSFDETIPPQVVDLDTEVQVWVGNKQAKVLYKGRSGGYPGIDQINLELPPDVTTGCYVPIAVRAAGVLSNAGSVAIAQSGGVCSDPQAMSADELRLLGAGAILRVGWIQLLRLTASGTMLGIPYSAAVDLGWADLFRMNPGSLTTDDPVVGWAGLALGSCTVMTMSEKTGSVFHSGRLNAGSSLHLTGPKGGKNWPRGGDGTYSRNAIGYQMQPDFLGLRPRPPYLDAGTYTVDNESGGPDLGPFVATLSLPNPIPLNWTSFGSTDTINRSQDLVVTWAGGDPSRDYVLVVGATAFPNMQDTQMGGAFACAERVDAGRLTVPSWILSAIPVPTPQRPSADQLFAVVRMPLFNAHRFTLPGRLDIGYFAYAEGSAKTVTYQ